MERKLLVADRSSRRSVKEGVAEAGEGSMVGGGCYRGGRLARYDANTEVRGGIGGGVGP